MDIVITLTDEQVETIKAAGNEPEAFCVCEIADAVARIGKAEEIATRPMAHDGFGANSEELDFMRRFADRLRAQRKAAFDEAAQIGAMLDVERQRHQRTVDALNRLHDRIEEGRRQAAPPLAAEPAHPVSPEPAQDQMPSRVEWGWSFRWPSDWSMETCDLAGSK